MLLGFKKQFAPKILDGSKIHTLRHERKREPKIGETLYMYYNLRNRYEKATKISDKHTLHLTQDVEMYIGKTATELIIEVWIDGRALLSSEIVELAKNDGFEYGYQLAEWFYGKSKEREISLTLKLHHWTKKRY